MKMGQNQFAEGAEDEGAEDEDDEDEEELFFSF